MLHLQQSNRRLLLQQEVFLSSTLDDSPDMQITESYTLEMQITTSYTLKLAEWWNSPQKPKTPFHVGNRQILHQFYEMLSPASPGNPSLTVGHNPVNKSYTCIIISTAKEEEEQQQQDNHQCNYTVNWKRVQQIGHLATDKQRLWPIIPMQQAQLRIACSSAGSDGH